MRHKRSEVSQQRRFIKRLVLECAFQDRQRSETVNILSREAIAASASQAFDYVLPGLTNYRSISFHTFRHWKATMLYHQTKDPYYVQHFLGHKKLTSTEIYINIEHTLFEAGANDEFTVKVAEKPEEIKALLELGFEYVLQKDNLIFLRKRR